jgi:hypothetical protein
VISFTTVGGVIFVDELEPELVVIDLDEHFPDLEIYMRFDLMYFSV